MDRRPGRDRPDGSRQAGRPPCSGGLDRMSDPSDAVPSAHLPMSASAPGKCILFGEHAVVHGGPEVLFALDLRTQLVFESSESPSLNGVALGTAKNPFVTEALA